MLSRHDARKMPNLGQVHTLKVRSRVDLPSETYRFLSQELTGLNFARGAGSGSPIEG